MHIIRPKKSLGQHFLNSPGVLAKIVGSAAPSAGERVLEIGPGTGVLTRELLKTGASVTSVEKDERSLAFLRDSFSAEIASGSLSLVPGDFLETDRRSLGLDDGGYSVVANIPYYITGAILESLLEHEPRPSRMTLLVQKEVAERIVAADGKESILSVSVKAFGQPAIVAKVPPGAFTPPPTVDSAILSITGISGGSFAQRGLETKRLFEIVRAGFAHKRKYAKRNLESAMGTEAISAAWLKLGLDDKARAEDLSVEDWMDLASA